MNKGRCSRTRGSRSAALSNAAASVAGEPSVAWFRPIRQVDGHNTSQPTVFVSVVQRQPAAIDEAAQHVAAKFVRAERVDCIADRSQTAQLAGCGSVMANSSF